MRGPRLSRRPPRSSGRGIAIPTALYLLVIVGFLVSAGVFATTRLRRGAALHLLDAALTAAADDALTEAIERWPGEARSRLVLGAVDSSISTYATPVPARATVRAIRLSESTFWLVAEVRADAWPETVRRVNLVVRVRPPPRAGMVALASAGDVSLAPSARLLPDTDASCVGEGATGGALSGIGAVALAPGARLLADAARAAADSVRVVSVADSESPSLLPFTPEQWRELAERAAARFSQGALVAAGEHPLAYAEGDLTLRGGVGSGVLLVEGRLTLGGALHFTGLIVARGGITTAGDGAVIEGLLVSAARDGPAPGSAAVSLRHAMEVRASRCAASRAAVAAVRPVPVHGRAWAELF